MISGDAYKIACFNLYLIVTDRLVIEYANHVMGILTSIIINIVERFKLVVCIWVKSLHNLKRGEENDFYVQETRRNDKFTSYATLHTCELNVHTRKSHLDKRSMSSKIPFSDESV